ncbi:FHA domain-containing protein [Cohnella herbarum]|uniref:FHA domain-containing protein n=1 Tax=Cohnella herbarum TaxID=2728023 RepID=A0A7Z2VP93_9BACL|nr:FHA domain-containing protein [Cohnella herbarum]QJD86757.1 FHA domain-containing protein [Cohnella herbarum]
MTEREQHTDERGNRFKYRWGTTPRLYKAVACVAVLLTGSQFMPVRASAAALSLDIVTSQVKVGTLPLLAALGVGIVVAVGAVIAFLQLTAKGRESRDPTQSAIDEDQETYEEQSLEEWGEEETTPNPEYEDNPLTDYTIPVTKILSYPDQAEPAEEDEPRLCGIEGEHAGSSYRVLGRRLTIGRDPAHCAILFPYEASEISRIHCTVRFIEESRLFLLEDNGSSNGTFLSNGDRLQPGVRYELRSGERFSLSGKEQYFEVRDEAGQGL